MSTIGPGDRAIIIFSVFPENLHKIVEVGRFVKEGELVPEMGMDYPFSYDGLLLRTMGSLLKGGAWKGGVLLQAYHSEYAVLPPSYLRKLEDPDNVDKYDRAGLDAERAWLALSATPCGTGPNAS